MSINKRQEKAESKIKKVYDEEVLNQYKSLFEKVGKSADVHMKNEGIESIKLSPDHLEYHSPGKFWEDGCAIGIEKLPGIYQKYSDSIAAQQNNRSHITLTYHRAMRNAFNDLRERVRKSLVDSI